MDYLLNCSIKDFLNCQSYQEVLNLIINGLPSKQGAKFSDGEKVVIAVLNLIINGLPSKQLEKYGMDRLGYDGFKPYYKWITF